MSNELSASLSPRSIGVAGVISVAIGIAVSFIGGFVGAILSSAFIDYSARFFGLSLGVQTMRARVLVVMPILLAAAVLFFIGQPTWMAVFCAGYGLALYSGIGYDPRYALRNRSVPLRFSPPIRIGSKIGVLRLFAELLIWAGICLLVWPLG